MIIKNIIDEDFINYKKSSMFIIFPFCTMKCDKENGIQICQNSEVLKQPDINISYENIVTRYINNPITNAIVMAGLEPFCSFEDLVNLIAEFRKHTHDDIVIYTGYYEDELEEQLKILKNYDNIIIKFGRFIPNQEQQVDPVLGIKLYKPQYAKKIS